MPTSFLPLAFLPPPNLTWVRTEERGWFRTISWIICTFLMLSLLTFNSIKWYQDLYGNAEIKSLNRTTSNSPPSSPSASGAKRKLPPKTMLYKFVVSAVQFSILFYSISSLVGFSSVWGWGCQWIFFFSLSSWEIAKGLMYIVFIIRLYTAYDESIEYRYPPLCLSIFGVIVAAISLTLTILAMIYAKVNPYVKYAHLKKTCGAFFEPELTSAIMLFDMLMILICVILFLYPLVRILMKVKEESEIDVGKMNKEKYSLFMKRIIHLGLKYLIVSVVAAITSFISLICIMLYAETTFVAWDQVVNSICIMLMLPYYSDGKFYNKLCCPCHTLCHVCCTKYNSVYANIIFDETKVSKAMELNTGNGTDGAKSDDTNNEISLEVTNS